MMRAPADDPLASPAARRALAASDPVMRALARRHGAVCPPWPRRRTPWEALARAIAYQQLHAKAAESILARFVALAPGRRFPRPEDVLALPEAALRGAGFSAAKTAALRDLAAKALAGVVPRGARVRAMDDEALVARLTAVRGVGRWTVEMLLIFQLRRPDVLPVDDFGVRDGFRLAYGLDEPPQPRALREYGARWAPWRTLAALYLWAETNAARERA